MVKRASRKGSRTTKRAAPKAKARSTTKKTRRTKRSVKGGIALRSVRAGAKLAEGHNGSKFLKA